MISRTRGLNGIRPVGALAADVHEASDPAARLRPREAEEPQPARGGRLLDGEDAEQDVLGRDLPVLQRAGLPLGGDEGPAAVAAEPVDHG